MQLDHYSSKFIKRQFPIVLICDAISNAPNIGSLFRTADAFGVAKLYLCGDYVPLGRKMTKTSRATEKAVLYELIPEASTVVADLKKQNYQIISIEITSDSIPIHKLTINSNQPIAIVIGAENFGISETLLNQSDAVVHIDMYGQNSSMNVVQATSIALYEITKQLI